MESAHQHTSVTLVDQKSITRNPPLACDGAISHRDAALCWFEYGFDVIPIVPGKKVSAVCWDPWLDGLSRQKIAVHWRMHPNHELGFIVGDDTIVFDADSPESIAALTLLEESLGLAPNFVVRTSKGLHHYFRRAEGTFAKSDSHCTERHPDRIDVKTGRSLVILPPSTGKSIALLEADNASPLAQADQAFVDAVARHNGRPSPGPHGAPALVPVPQGPSGQALACVAALLKHVDSDCGYDDWLRVLMAIYYAISGSADGLELADAWSSTGKKYKGIREIKAKWDSFRLDHPRPITIAFLRKMVAANGHDWMAICAAAEDPFTRVAVEQGDA